MPVVAYVYVTGNGTPLAVIDAVTVVCPVDVAVILYSVMSDPLGFAGFHVTVTLPTVALPGVESVDAETPPFIPTADGVVEGITGVVVLPAEEDPALFLAITVNV